MHAAHLPAAVGWLPCHPSRRAVSSTYSSRYSVVREARRSRPRDDDPRRNKRRSRRRQADSEPEGIDADELLRLLNNGHEWLQHADDTDFGLDDVAAHAAQSDQQAVPLDISSSSSSSKALSSAAQDLLPYAEELKAAGFDLMARQGELFAQRSSTSTNSSSSSRRTGVRQPRTANPSLPGKQATKQPGAPGNAAKPLASGHCSVPREFSEQRWLPLLQQSTTHSGTTSSSSSGSSTTSGGGMATPASGVKAQGWLEEAGLSASQPGPLIRSFVPTPKHSTSSSSSQQQAPAVQKAMVKVLQACNTPEQLLQQLALVSPSWAANAYHLVPLSQGTDAPDSSSSKYSALNAALVVVDAPTPAEASAVLQVLARIARRTLQPAQILSLARDRRVLGLVECLRVTPPRLHLDPGSTKAAVTQTMWAAAKAYWLQQQQPAASPTTGGGAAVTTPAQQQAVGSVQDQGQLGQQPAGASATTQPSVAGSRIRAAAVADAMWALGVLGGPNFFQQEMEALLQVTRWGAWPFKPRQLANVLWALGQCRHWSDKVPSVEAALMQAGGLQQLTPGELCSALWGCATLSYVPQQLLKQLGVAWGGFLVSEQQSQHKKPRRGASRTAASVTALSSSQLANVVWALAVLQLVEHPVFTSAWQLLLARGMTPDLGTRQLLQVWQAQMAVQLEGGPVAAKLGQAAGGDKLLAAAATAMKQQTAALEGRLHSSYQRDIAKALSTMGVLHTAEDSSSGYAVDVSVPSLKLAIEADGPSHMARTGGGQRMLGATSLKRRHLQLLGWRVVNVRYKDWDKLNSEELRRAFLQQQLKAAAAAAASVS